MRYAYTAIFTPEENGLYSVKFPDFQGCRASGDNLTDAAYMAQDVLCLTLYDLEQDKKSIPQASKPGDIKTAGDQFTSLVVADTETYRRESENNPRKNHGVHGWTSNLRRARHKTPRKS